MQKTFAVAGASPATTVGARRFNLTGIRSLCREPFLQSPVQ
jgi:hypothetical protein